MNLCDLPLCEVHILLSLNLHNASVKFLSRQWLWSPQVTVFGAGLLVATALAVVIPEGFAALDAVYSSEEWHGAAGEMTITCKQKG